MIFLFHSKYRITMYPMSINFISVLHTSCMIPRKVDQVEANPYKKQFYSHSILQRKMMRRQSSHHLAK